MDSTLPAETADCDHEWDMRDLKRTILEEDSYRFFLAKLMRQTAKRDEGWESAAEELANRWECGPEAALRYRDAVPWYTPRELDVRRAAFELMEFFWPILMEWREGFVDQSELHILVRSGGMGWVKGEGERIDVAVIGHRDRGLIVEFLPMFGVDPDAALAAKRHAMWLLDLVVEQGRGDAWSYAKYHCGTASNAYSTVRFVGRAGRKALETVELQGGWEQSPLVRRQPPVAEHATEGVRTVLRNDGQVQIIEVESCGESFGALLFDLRHDCFTLRFYPSDIARDCGVHREGPPRPGGTMCCNIFAPYERGYFVDDRGHATDYALEMMGKVTKDLGHHSQKLFERLEDIREALAIARRRNPGTDLTDEQFLVETWDSIVGPPIDVDLQVFCNIVGEWVRGDTFELRSRS